MVKQFEDGKVYVIKGSKKPYEEIIEAAVYKTKNDAGQIEENLLLDFYIFDGTHHYTKARMYETTSTLEPAENHNPKDFDEIGTVGIEYIEDDYSLIEAKPSYTDLEKALKKIARARNCDFRNWKQRGDEMQKIAQEALRAGR